MSTTYMYTTRRTRDTRNDPDLKLPIVTTTLLYGKHARNPLQEVSHFYD